MVSAILCHIFLVPIKKDAFNNLNLGLLGRYISQSDLVQPTNATVITGIKLEVEEKFTKPIFPRYCPRGNGYRSSARRDKKRHSTIPLSNGHSRRKHSAIFRYHSTSAVPRYVLEQYQVAF